MAHLSGGDRHHLRRWSMAFIYTPAAQSRRTLAVGLLVAACRRGLQNSRPPRRSSPHSSGGWVACYPAVATLVSCGPRSTDGPCRHRRACEEEKV